MSLTSAPPLRMLPEPGQPFVVYAIWPASISVDGTTPLIAFSAANLPGGPLGEFAVSGSLARPLAQVRPDELPIALSLDLVTVEGREGPIGQWRFDFLGQSDAFAEIWRVPPEVQPNGPRPLTPAELNAGAEEQVRESLGIPPDEPIPHPSGELPPEERAEEPYRFDPTPHLDLSQAEPPPALPEPVATNHGAFDLTKAEAPPAIPERVQGDRHGGYGDRSVPFAH